MSHFCSRRSALPLMVAFGVLSAVSCQQFLGLDAYDVTYTTGGASGAGGSAGKASGGDAGDDAGGTGGKGGSGGKGGDGGGGGGGKGGDGGSAGSAGSAGTGGSVNTGCADELLVNPYFDDGNTGWMYASSAGLLSAIYHQQDTAEPGFPIVTADTPFYLAWLGGWEDVENATVTDTSRLRQNITIPSNATELTLTGQIQTSTDESGPDVYDTLEFVLFMGGNEVATFTDVPAEPVYTNVDDFPFWTPFEFTIDATAYQGQTLAFELRSFCDAALITQFYLDSLSLCPSP